MRMPIVTAVLFLLLSGCNDDGGSGRTDHHPAVPERITASSISKPVADGSEMTEQASTWLAYRHGIHVRTGDVAGVFARTRDACLQAQGCRLLHASVSGGDMPTASLSMRVPRETLVELRGVVEESGNIISSSTSAEDRAAEVADIEARRFMMAAHRDRLIEIQSEAGSVEDLMRIAQELVRIQAEIERLDGRFRVIGEETSTDLLDVTLTTPISGGRWYAPVLRGIEGIPAEFASSLGSVVVFLAMAIPWLLPLSAGIWTLRRLMRRRRASARLRAEPPAGSRGTL